MPKTIKSPFVSCSNALTPRAIGMAIIHISKTIFASALPEVSSRNLLFGSIKFSTQRQQLFQGPLGAMPAAIAPKDTNCHRQAPRECLHWHRPGHDHANIDTLVLFRVATKTVLFRHGTTVPRICRTAVGKNENSERPMCLHLPQFHPQVAATTLEPLFTGPGQLLKTRIKLIAATAGFGNIGWHTFRHSFSAWGKEALKLETKELLRHENLSTTSELYGGLSLEAKRRASERSVQYVKQAAQVESMKLGKVDAGNGECPVSRLSVPRSTLRF